MKQSELVYTTYKEKPKEEEAKNAILLIRAGFIEKVAAGIYSFLPLGFRVLKKIETIIRQELNAVGCQEVLLPALHPKENWRQTDRWNKLDVLFKTKSQTGLEYALGPTHEEIIFPVMKKLISSYKDLPKAVYQIQTKFRDELRAKSGLLRNREFLMKDLYSFHQSSEEVEKFKAKIDRAYLRIFSRCGLKVIVAKADGGTFSPFSTEFQVVAEAGEDVIYYCGKCGLAWNEEVFKGDKCEKCQGRLARLKSIEVGNTFNLDTRYSQPFGLQFKDKDGQAKLVYAGCYGIGVARLMGTIVEIRAGEHSILWPKEVSPFGLHLLIFWSKTASLNKKLEGLAAALEKQLKATALEYLIDERMVSIGEKFAESDLFGIPNRLILSEKTLIDGKIELQQRLSEKKLTIKKLKITAAIKFLVNNG